MGETNNPPSQKISDTATFRALFMFNREMTGSGKHKTRRSKAMLVATCASPKAVELYRKRLSPRVKEADIGSTCVSTSCESNIIMC